MKLSNPAIVALVLSSLDRLLEEYSFTKFREPAVLV
jgi:hypothetical protein